MTRRFWKSNLAHIVGWVVVVVGVTTLGVANALPGKNTVDSGDIINGQVKRADIAGGAVNGAKVANGSLTGADIADGTVRAADLAPAVQHAYFARVGHDGTDAVLVAGRGVDSVEYDDAGGDYVVTFDAPVEACAWTASINPFFGGPPTGWNEIVVGPTWDNTVVPPQDQTPDPHELRVLITDGENNPAGTGTDPATAHLQTFTVVVNC